MQLFYLFRLEIWPGYVTAVDNYEGGLMLQCDVSHRVLRCDTVLECMSAIAAKKHQSEVKKEVEKALLGSIVLTRYNNKVYKIDDVDFQSNPTKTFETSNGEKISFIQYYQRQYGITIKDHKQPLLVHR